MGQIQTPFPQVQIGANAQTVINGANRNTFAAYDGSQRDQQRQELEAIIRETDRDIKRMQIGTATTPNVDVEALRSAEAPFVAAYQHINDMLTGKTKLSVADAYYTMERGYGNPYLTKPEYDGILAQSVDFIRNWMQQHNLDPKDNLSVHLAIQKFMSQSLTVSKAITLKDGKKQFKTVTHQPFFYDYDDYQAFKDHRNFFLTKCLATGSGQCSSMPAVYLVLSEALGVKAYLSFAPMHSFIKYPDNSGAIQNYEPTSNWEISDKWYMDNMFISQEARNSGLFLDTLNSRQVVAHCVFDLCFGYTRKNDWWDHAFLKDAILSAAKYFPRNNNLVGLAMYSVYLRSLLFTIMRANHIKAVDDIPSNVDAMSVYQEFLGNEAYIKRLGYQDVPDTMYAGLMQEHEFKGRLQKMRNYNGKQKRSLFISTNN